MVASAPWQPARLPGQVMGRYATYASADFGFGVVQASSDTWATPQCVTVESGLEPNSHQLVSDLMSQ